MQEVSSTPSTRVDVVQLQELLDLRLRQRQARETGICPVRRELYAQCFGQHRTGTAPAGRSAPPRAVRGTGGCPRTSHC